MCSLYFEASILQDRHRLKMYLMIFQPKYQVILLKPLFTNANQNTVIEARNANKDVQYMINRAMNTKFV